MPLREVRAIDDYDRKKENVLYFKYVRHFWAISLYNLQCLFIYSQHFL